MWQTSLDMGLYLFFYQLKYERLSGQPPTLDNLPATINVLEDIDGSLVVVRALYTVLASQYNKREESQEMVPLNFTFTSPQTNFSLTFDTS